MAICDISDKPFSGGRPTLNEELLKETSELDPRHSTRDLARKLNVSYSTVHEHLERIGKVQKGDFGFLMNFRLRTEPNIPPSSALF